MDHRSEIDYLYLRQLERDADEIEPDRRWPTIIARLAIFLGQLTIVLRQAQDLPLRALWNFAYNVVAGLSQISVGLAFRFLRRLFRAVWQHKAAMKFLRLKLIR